jgi:hypothetical protein
MPRLIFVAYVFLALIVVIINNDINVDVVKDYVKSLDQCVIHNTTTCCIIDKMTTIDGIARSKRVIYSDFCPDVFYKLRIGMPSGQCYHENCDQYPNSDLTKIKERCRLELLKHAGPELLSHLSRIQFFSLLLPLNFLVLFFL